MDWEDIGRIFERQPTKLVSIDKAAGLIRAYEATAGGAPKLRSTVNMSDIERQITEQGKDPT